VDKIKRKIELTHNAVKALAHGKHFVGGCAGLMLIVDDHGKRWVLRVRSEGKQMEFGLGSFFDRSLSDARAVGTEYRAKLLQGIDPRPAKMLLPKTNLSKTFGTIAARYIEAHSPKWTNAKHAAQWASSLAKFANPVIGGVDVAAVTKEQVREVIGPIWLTKHETASRVRQRIEQVLDYSLALGYRTAENPARIELHKTVLPAFNKAATVKSFASMDWRESADFYKSLIQETGIASKCLALTMLTACRSGESRGASWDEINLEECIWTVPAERMKKRKEHRVPLSTEAIKLLESMPRFEGQSLVFPSAKQGKKLSDMALTAVMRRRFGDREIIPTVHGFRSTFKSWADDSNAASHKIIELCLAHAIGDSTERAYTRTDRLSLRAVLMQQWTDKLARTAKVQTAEVVELGAARG
jgi:integrase